MSDRALDILNRLTESAKPRSLRLMELLKAPEAGSEGWFMYVPSCFNAALDIKQEIRSAGSHQTLVWTQGPYFSFAAGDTLYNKQEGYSEWAAALKTINYCVQVTHATPVSVGKSEGVLTPGSVKFNLLTPNEDRSALVVMSSHTVTQKEFVRFLVDGPVPRVDVSFPQTKATAVVERLT